MSKPEIGIAIKTIKTVKNDYSDVKRVIVIFSVISYSSVPVCIQNLNCIFEHNKKKIFESRGDNTYYPINLSLESSRSDEYCFEIPLNVYPFDTVLNNDKLQFYIEYISTDGKLTKGIINYEYDGEKWREINNYASPKNTDIHNITKFNPDDSNFDYPGEEKKVFEAKSFYPKDNALTFKDFIVYSDNKSCAMHHKTKSVTAVVNLIKPDGTQTQDKIYAAYCENCDKYYILKNDYFNLRKKGIILCQQIEVDKLINSSNSGMFSNFNLQSKLMLLGYSVSEKENLTMYQRQSLLRNLVNLRIMSKEEITSHLSMLIDLNANNSNFENARMKWQLDLDFIKAYNFTDYPELGVRSIKQVIYHKK